MQDQIIKPGSVRHLLEGAYKVTSPGDKLYSLALFVAEEIYLGDTGWEKLSEPE
jgi:hypothetical protein